MDFSLNEEHKAVQTAAREFARTVLKPGTIERDETMHFPGELIIEMGKAGFLGMMTDQKFGGSGMDTLSYAIAVEEIAKVDASAAVIMSVNNSLVCWGLEKYGSEEQKQKFLYPLASGAKLGAFALSEPEAGSDATEQQTTAEKRGDKYVLNGIKNWITNGNSSDIVLVVAQSDKALKHKGINVLIVEKGEKGFTVGPKENKMGIRSSDTHQLIFSDVGVPASNLILPELNGFRFAMETLNGGRIGIAAQALGIAAGAYELALQYSKERKSFGQPISRHQAIQFKLAEMATQIDAARLMVYKAAFLKDTGRDYAQESAQAKLFASRVAMEVTTEAVQVHGGYGYVKEFHVERMMRDAKITQIYEGTSEIQKVVISRNLLKN